MGVNDHSTRAELTNSLIEHFGKVVGVHYLLDWRGERGCRGTSCSGVGCLQFCNPQYLERAKRMTSGRNWEFGGRYVEIGDSAWEFVDLYISLCVHINIYVNMSIFI